MDPTGAPVGSYARTAVIQSNINPPESQAAGSSRSGVAASREPFRQSGRSSESLEQFAGEDAQHEKPSNVCMRLLQVHNCINCRIVEILFLVPRSHSQFWVLSAHTWKQHVAVMTKLDLIYESFYPTARNLL